MKARLRETYKEIREEIKDKHGFSSVMQVPRIEKVVLSIGAGKIFADSSKMDSTQEVLSYIAGQKACFRTAKKSVAGFKVREGMKTGIMVTLRKANMYEFLDRLRNIALPRLRDFRGFNEKSFNGKSFSFGLKDYTIFPEVRALMKSYELLGVNITIVVNKNDEKAFKSVLLGLGFPFKGDK